MRILGDGLLPEAVSVEDFKRRVPMAESPDFDAGLAGILAAATATVETGTNRPLAPRAVEFHAPMTSGQAWLRWWFPCAPVVEVTEVAVLSDGAWVDLDAGDWVLDAGHDEPQLVLADAVREVHGDAPVRVRATVGYDVALPDALVQAVILIAQEWHMAGAGLGDAVPEVRSFAAHALMRQNRYTRPKVVA